MHGTFANHDDDHGEQWWQKDSPFQKQIADRIGTGSGDIEWAPFHWSGANSETERRVAGAELYAFLDENFEQKDRPYHLVGHSHGGSVIAETLRVSVAKNNKLEQLQGWTTVATPFLAFQKKKNLFQRLRRRYQLLLALALAYVVAILLAVPIGMCDGSVGLDECWVRKEGGAYSDLANATRVRRSFSSVDNIDLENLPDLVFKRPEVGTGGGRSIDLYGFPTFGLPQRSNNSVHIGKRLHLKFASPPAGVPPKSFSVAAIRGVGTFNTSPGHFDLLLTESREFRIEEDQSPDGPEGLVYWFNRLANYEGNETGIYPLNICSVENLMFFGLTTNGNRTISDIDSLNRPGNKDLVHRYGLGCEELDKLAQYKNENEAEEAQVAEAVNESALPALTPEILNDLFINSFSRVRNLGFTEPQKLTFEAKYKGGKRRLLQMEFHKMDAVKITPFIPRFEILLSRALMLYLPLMLLPALGIAFFIWRTQKNLRARYSHSDNGRFTQWYRHNWRKLSHPDDEAINAISTSTKIEAKIAPPDLLKGWFMLIASCAVAIFLMLHGVKFFNYIRGNGFSSEEELVNVLGSAISAIHNVLSASDESIFSTLSTIGTESKYPRLGTVGRLFLWFGITLSAAVLIARGIEKFILNPALKSSIDKVVKSSTVQSAFGDNALGEASSHCQPHPPEFSDPPSDQFPAPVQKAIEAHANRDLNKLANSLRTAINKGATSVNGFSFNDLYEGETSEVLIHTSYFAVDEFQDLIAAAWVDSGDYSAKPGFNNFKKAEKWIDNL